MTALAVSLWIYLFGPPTCERAAEMTPEPAPRPPVPVLRVPETQPPRIVVPPKKKKDR